MMDPHLIRRVQRYGWDKASHYYERYWALPLQGVQTRTLELAKLSRGDRVLDLACGTGLLAFPAGVTVGPDGEVIAADISDRMVEYVAAEANRRGMLHVKARQMDAEELDCEDCSFDVVICSLGLMYFPDPLRAVREMYRVLVPGGRLVLSVWGRRQECGWAELFPIVDAKVTSEVCPRFFEHGSDDSLRHTLEQADCDDILIERLRAKLPFSNEESALGAAFAGGPVSMAYARFSPATRRKAQDEYLASIEQYRNGSGYQIPGEFVLARGRRK